MMLENKVALVTGGTSGSGRSTAFAFCTDGEATVHVLSSNANFWDVACSVKSQLNQSITPDKLLEKILHTQEWWSTHPNPDDALQAFKDMLDCDITVSNLMQLTIGQQFGELELQAVYGPVLPIGVENKHFVGVATLGDRLCFTLVGSEGVMLRSKLKTLHKEAIYLVDLLQKSSPGYYKV